MLGKAFDRLPDQGRRAHRHGALRHDDLLLVHALADRSGDVEHVLEVGRAVLVRRRAHRDEDDLRLLCDPWHIGREAQAAGGDVPLHQGLESGFIDGDMSPVQRLHLLIIDVAADDRVAGLRQAGAGNEADVSSPYDSNTHRWSRFFGV